MSMMVIPVGVSALGLLHKGLLRGLEELKIRGRAETIQTIALLRSRKILGRDLDT